MKNNYKATVALLLRITISISLQAQTVNTPPTIAWQRTFGGSKDDVANCVKPTADGGFVVTGSGSSNDADMQGNNGIDDFFLVKLDAAGNVLWQHTYGGTLIDGANSVALTWDGGYVMAGKSSSNDDDVTGNHGFSDYWIIKTDDKGIMEWQKSYGGSQSDVANAMQVTSDSGFVIAGISFSYDGDISSNHGGAEAWIIKLDKSGTLQWQKSMGGSKFEIANDIQQTRDGGFIATGYTTSNDGDITYNHGQEDVWLIKLDKDGNLKWQKTMGGSGGDCGSAVQQTIDGGYVICGLSHSRDFDVTETHGAHDMWIIKTDSLGQIQWTRAFGGSDGDDGVDIKQQPDGNLIACAFASSNDDQVSGGHGQYDFWLTGLSSEGVLLWQKTLGGTREDYPHSLQILPDGNFIVAGRTNSNNNDVSGNHGDYDGWVVMLNPGCNNIFYADADGDEFGDHKSVIYSCTQPIGCVSDNTDCNDDPATGGAIHTGATEVCNGLDDDCNGQIDENCGTFTYYADIDNDTYGDVNNSIASSSPAPPLGYVVDNTDCNDNDPFVHSQQLFYIDADEDGYGSSMTAMLCAGSNTPGYSFNNFDCDDANAAIYPGATEFCNYLDDNCNNQTDEGAVSAVITTSGSTKICSGGMATLYANTGDGLIYQWQWNDFDLPGATNSSLNAKVSGSFKVKVSSGTCNTTSESIYISVSPSPAATINPSGTIFSCPGISVTLNANPGSDLNYQWQKSGVIISDATNAGYTPSSIGFYRVIVTNSYGCSKISAITKFIRYAAASTKISDDGNLNICQTGATVISAKIIAGYSYQWFIDDIAIAGATETSYTATEAGTYYYQATTADGCVGISASEVVTGCRLENESIGLSALSLYPNPSDGNFNIDLHLENRLNATARIEIINMLGNIILAEETDTYEGALLHNMTVKNKLPDALYYLKLIVGDQVFFQPIMFQK